MYYSEFSTQFCDIIIAGDEQGIRHLHLNTGQGKRQFSIAPDWQQNDVLFAEARRQIQAYAAGELKDFSLSLNPQGSAFQQRVWQALYKIPFAQLRTYKDIAIAIAQPSAARAVGMANSRNPIPLIVPCHRVIGSNGKLTGFAGGLDIKQRLIEWEQHCCK
ncbi:methylated-DNA--[protein]-cysteine S-methyltransferase [Candidatus Venteria ishoeyi]|uniref:methylated-DNA--[protein]-cysteine S-methyltransferase n=1 Tax=Candidatus Venteria ishoeyi TaxID=1899563 RepID=UPI0025A62B53|nr:methylated-DNA--[protein]-cysteine S-methyltransferase [Candidatus Venteria ishoeyi]MDM8546922.1 methylated-DNA--[protein]-cysteine S-methyltransferase [Candidatus Venteria ishoeyi]